MNQKIKKIAATSTLLLASMHAFNYFTDKYLIPVTSSKNDKTFLWKDMKINYSERGQNNNPALLLLHDLNPSSSKEEWYYVEDTLAENFHIYEIDLLGCGKSDKPNIIYINYMYVQLIHDFIKNIIGQKTNICVTGYSSSFTFMTARIYPEMIHKIIVINPPSIDKLLKPATKKEKAIEKVLSLPVIGTFVYNYIMNKDHITDKYTYEYFYNKNNIESRAINISYYNAHYGHSNGRYLLGSIAANYTNINIIHALPKISQKIYLISNVKNKTVSQEYKKYKQSAQIIYVSNCRLLPQLEISKTIAEKISHILLDS